MISLEKWYILTPLKKLIKIVGDLGEIIVAKGFKKLPNLVTLINGLFFHYFQSFQQQQQYSFTTKK